jgi:hypothetical protein
MTVSKFASFVVKIWRLRQRVEALKTKHGGVLKCDAEFGPYIGFPKRCGLEAFDKAAVELEVAIQKFAREISSNSLLGRARKLAA